MCRDCDSPSSSCYVQGHRKNAGLRIRGCRCKAMINPPDGASNSDCSRIVACTVDWLTFLSGCLMIYKYIPAFQVFLPLSLNNSGRACYLFFKLLTVEYEAVCSLWGYKCWWMRFRLLGDIERPYNTFHLSLDFVNMWFQSPHSISELLTWPNMLPTKSVLLPRSLGKTWDTRKREAGGR